MEEPDGRAKADDPSPSRSLDFVDCYRVHYPRLVKSLQLAGAPLPAAEDVAQEAFSRTLVHWPRVQKGDNPPGYVYRTAFRMLYKRKPLDLLGDDADVRADIPHEGSTALRVTVEQLLSAMPPRRRSCAVLCLLLEFSPRDAAELLGMADGTVRKHLEQARADLRLGL